MQARTSITGTMVKLRKWFDYLRAPLVVQLPSAQLVEAGVCEIREGSVSGASLTWGVLLRLSLL